MSLSSFLARWTTRAVAVAMFSWSGSAVSAADVAPPPPPPVIVGAAPATVGEFGSCPTCQGGAVSGSCATCGKKCDKILKHKGYYPVNLCPGACFGYFQTQWRKWDEVCPYPYLGHGVSDAPKVTTGVLAPRPGGELTPPRPFEPKMPEPKKPEPKKVGSLDLPPIPTVPSKFAP